MLDKIAVGAAVWLASNPTGRKVAAKSFRVLSALGGYAVGMMPDNIAGAFRSGEQLIKELAADKQQQ